MLKRDREYVNGYDDEYDVLIPGESHTKITRSGYSQDPHARRSSPEVVETLRNNPFFKFQHHLYVLSKNKKPGNETTEFYRNVDELFDSFEDAVNHFEDWLKYREIIDGGKSVINKTISFIFYDLASLASFTNKTLSAHKLIFILRQLEQQALNAPAIISRSFLGLGILIEKGNVTEQISTTLIENFLTDIVKYNHLNDKELAHCITGFRLLSSSLDAPIKIDTIHQLIKQMDAPAFRNKAVIQVIQLLDSIAQMNILTEPLDASLIESLIKKFYSLPNLDETKHYKMLRRLERLINTKLLKGFVDAQLISQILNYALFQNVDLSQSLSTLTQLIVNDHVSGVIGFSRIIHTFNKRPANIQQTAELIYISGLLAQKGHLKTPILGQAVQDLIHTLSSMVCHTENQAGDIFSGLALLVQTNHLNVNQLKHVPYNVTSLLQELPLNRITSVNAEKILFGLVTLRAQMHCLPEQLEKIVFSALGLKEPMTPHRVLKYIDWFTKLAQTYPNAQLNEGFENLLLSTNFTLDDLNVEDSEQFNRVLLALKPNRIWAESLSNKLGIPEQRRAKPVRQDDVVMQESNNSEQQAPSFRIPSRNIQTTPQALPTRATPVSRMPVQKAQITTVSRQPLRVAAVQNTSTSTTSRSLPVRPTITRIPTSREATHPESWNTAYRENVLFKAIADRNMQQLARLLGISVETPIRTHTFLGSLSTRASNNHHGAQAHPKTDEQQAANTAVSQFLQKTEANALRILVSQATASYFELLLRACSNHTRYQLAQKNMLRPILLYLPIQELERHIPDLLSLELYRDSAALVNIINTLKTRVGEHPEELERVKQLQILLLDRAIEFHQSLFHNNVLSILRTEKAFVLKTTNTGQSVQQTRPTHPPIRREGSTPMQAPQRMFAPQPERLVVNRRYHYEAEDMNRILRLRLTNLNLSEENTPNLSVLSAANMNNGSRGNRVVDVLKQYFAGAEGQLVINNQVDHNIIIPIVHNHHWVGIRIQLKHGQSPQITYYNTVNDYEYDYELQVNILVEVNKALRNKPWQEPSIRRHDKTLIQDDASSCGPMLIESIYCDLTKRFWRQTQDPGVLAEKIRRHQLKLLESKDAQFYQRFYAHQAEQPERNTNSSMSLT